MTNRKIRIKLSPMKFGTAVEVDGKEIDHVTAVHVSHSVGELPIVTLSLITTDLEIEGEAPVIVERPL